MKTRTIEKIIRAKINAWCKSIEDDKESSYSEESRETLSESIKKSYIVTGGAIVSMLQNEKPNDFDVYFDDVEICLEVTKYYAAKLDGEDFVEIDKVDPTRVRAIPRAQGMLKPETKPEDPNYFPVCITENAVTLTDGIQFITRFTGDPEKIHENYDFVHVKSYMTDKTGLVFNKESLISIMTKELKYIGSKYPLSSIIRTRKFIKRGWTCGASEFLKMIFDVSQLDLKNYDVLREQLVGVDVVHFNNLIAKLTHMVDKCPEGEEYRPFFFDIIDEVFASSDPSHEEMGEGDDE